MTEKVTFIGLGVMGFPMAGHLADNGFDVSVYNRSAQKSALWGQRYSGRSCHSISEAVTEADYVISCVQDDDAVRQITLGNQGAFAFMKKGAVFIDHSTSSAKVAQQCFKQALQADIAFVDAPVSGGEIGAQEGQLTVMCGGDKEAYEEARPIINHYAKACHYMGQSGNGQLCKMVNQICVAGLLQGLAEGLMFSEQAGLDSERVIEVIQHGAAQSWQMDNRYRTMIAGDYDFGFAVDLMRKDLGICMDEAQRNGAPLPVAEMVDDFYKDVQEMGGNRWDTSSLLERLRQQNKANK